MWFWLFLVSLLVNFLAVYYVRWLIKSLEAINQDIDMVNSIILDFRNHIESIYELEMFYGDDTLKALIEHSKDLSSQLDKIDLVINEKEEQDLAEET
tara:strand:+ start:55 stop:345 length:291 start_codon:yes stop_codon:yes gene_type:complete